MIAEKYFICDRCGAKIPESKMVKYGSRLVADGEQYIFAVDRKIAKRGKGVWQGSRLLFCQCCCDSFQRFFDDWMQAANKEESK